MENYANFKRCKIIIGFDNFHRTVFSISIIGVVSNFFDTIPLKSLNKAKFREGFQNTPTHTQPNEYAYNFIVSTYSYT